MNDDIPKHIVIIPDGNRRWAKTKGLNPWAGHQEGIKRFSELIEEISKLGISYFSFWALSIDNIKNRPKREINFLLKILDKKLKEIKKDKRVHEKKIRINILGFWKKLLPKEICKSIEEVIEATKNYNNFFLSLFVAYDGKKEMLNAIEQIEDKVIKNPNLKIAPNLIKQNLFTKDLPPVDYLIRTGGEPHLSAGFMMWDIADTQLYFTNICFPDFDKKELHKAIKEYQKRERRLGG